MTTAALTARYRPQTFAEVAGQDTVKAILSRAALEGKVAPAYLFSGTRGVGKTTLARVFAKALNCRRAPAAEPCNQCDLCRAVTLGNAVDVVEIDGASNRGIDDVRRLREVVGYAPMDGRYKIFIIDEAHMLSREAFNALLKTLEEPPAGVTFILATTEPHKFPPTIISRCQHFAFKRLPEKALQEHLAAVLEREGLAFDQAALRLIARRGAGSVRDAMSLLAQVLALGEDRLTEETARSVLGLAGQETFARMLAAFRDGDCLLLSRLLRELLDQGLDLGFFLRELAGLWRNLFILRQTGQAGLSAADLPESEGRRLLEAAADFSPAHIHACWQMTLEGQRRVLTALEPALALELLLLNLAMLPRILPLESLLGRDAPAQQASVQDSRGQDGRLEPGTPSARSWPLREPAAPAPAAPEPPVPEPPVPPAGGPCSLAREPDAPSLPEAPQPRPSGERQIPALPDWPDILRACAAQESSSWFIPLARKVSAQWQEGRLLLLPPDPFTARRLEEPAAQDVLRSALASLCSSPPLLEIAPPADAGPPRRSQEELRREIARHPLVRELEKIFAARIVDCGQSR
ncbi:MAG: DNA polymerase III subunit gamma/tau [Desulfovibrio sp.]|jgi:DNA polymerase-3 subunit gamma/tau|nr:DNA polymerase III subunit gamma/tau [Desulfovibrio sp.]